MMKKTWRLLDGTLLKLLAMVSMVFDHVGDNFIPDQEWMRIIGRIAMPLFAFAVAEGYIHTHDRKKYLLRMLLMGMISEIPFDLVLFGKPLEFTHQNIMLTFTYAILGLMCYDRISRDRDFSIPGILVLLLFVISSLLLCLDYNMVALAVIFTFYLLRKKPLWFRTIAAMLVYYVFRNVGVYRFGLLGFLPVFLYNGQRGKGFKWLFYLFYPGHLLLIYLLMKIL
ncbi:MAG: hypothetical protein IKS51_02205 [Erysipelotrichaceae bacterium]|nr:hypothetical protein [Erysipelotrichaceae bacterium]